MTREERKLDRAYADVDDYIRDCQDLLEGGAGTESYEYRLALRHTWDAWDRVLALVRELER